VLEFYNTYFPQSHTVDLKGAWGKICLFCKLRLCGWNWAACKCGKCAEIVLSKTKNVCRLFL